VKATFAGLAALEHVNFELHALDVLDRTDGLPPQLAQAQRDLQVPAAEKLRRLREVVGWLRAGRELLTVAEAAQRAADQV